MAGKQRVDCEPAQLAQRTHELLEAAVVDVLEQDRAAVEDDVAGEQASAPALLEQERKAAFAESLVDGAGLEAVVGGIGIGEVEAERARADEVDAFAELHPPISPNAPLRTSDRPCLPPSSAAPSRRPATSSRSSARSGRASGAGSSSASGISARPRRGSGSPSASRPRPTRRRRSASRRGPLRLRPSPSPSSRRRL